MKNLPQQICMVKLPKQPVKTIRTNFVEEYHELANEIEDFASQLNKKSPYHLSPSEAVVKRNKTTETIQSQIDSEISEDEDDRWQR